MANEVIETNGTIVLDWTDVSGATYYDVAIAKYQDFATGTEYSGTIASSTITHTLVGGNDKFYWKWRSYDGTNYDDWREINSFIADTGATNDVTVANTKWVFIVKGTESDTYVFEDNPLDWEIYEANVNRSFKRNMRGELLSEWIDTKGKLILDFSKQQSLGTNQKAEFQRFYNLHDSFYVAKKFDAQDNVESLYKIWEVEFDKPLQMERTGNLRLEFIEV